jgi:hypothetical protein
MTEREEEISCWFSDQSHCFVYDSDRPLEARFYETFETVLSVLTEEQFEEFMMRSPVMLFFPKTNGRVFEWRFPVPRGAEAAKRTFMYFPPNAARWSDKRLVKTFSHEIAHIVLGHAGLMEGSNYEWEKAADALSVSWGFGASYAKKKLEALKKRAQEIKAYNDRIKKERGEKR